MATTKEIVNAALEHGDKRSAEYRRGMLDVLRFRLEGIRITCPYKAGTAQFDAYFSGNSRGHELARPLRESWVES